MFVDYYSLFEISSAATEEEIKSAFKKQALKWHPDRNPNIDTTEKMQLLNEAKLILLDSQGREKYDVQYKKFKGFEDAKHQSEHESTQPKQPEEQSRKPFEKKYSFADFDIDDEILKKWMANAKKQSVDLAKQTIEELKGMSKAGVKAGAKAMGNAFIYQVIISIIVLIIFSLSKSCN